MGKSKKKNKGSRRKRRAKKKPELPPMPDMHKVSEKLNAALEDDAIVEQLMPISEEVYELVLEASLLIGLDDELEAGGFAGVLFALGSPDPNNDPPDQQEEE